MKKDVLKNLAVKTVKILFPITITHMTRNISNTEAKKAERVLIKLKKCFSLMPKF